MTVALVGTVVDNCDSAGNFTTLNSGANISGDDDFVEGTGAVGDKMSNTTELLVSDTLSGGASGVYDFSSGGADEGAHFIGWCNTKTPINATTGLVVYLRNAAGHFGRFNAIPANFYKGGFITQVKGMDQDFDTASTWTTNGNPAQLDDVDSIGYEFTTTTSIMGSFNNTQVDQFTIGFGIRVDVGTSGTPNTFEDVYVQDEDTSFWGWWFRSQAKGKLYIGPASGDTASWFVDSAFSVKFANEDVNVGFYEFDIRGGNTTCEWTLANIFAETPSVARWSLTLDSGMGSITGGFVDTSGAWNGSDVITLNQYAELSGTALVDGTSLIQNDALLDGVSVIAANTATGVAYITSDNISGIKNSTFEFSAGHAIEITTTGTYNVDNDNFIGYSGTGNSASIYNNSGGLVTLNVLNGSAGITVRNGAGASTVVNQSVNVELGGVSEGTAVAFIAAETVGTITDGDVLSEGFADDNGEYSFSINYEGAFDPSGLDTTVRARNQGICVAAIADDGGVFTDETEEASSNTTGDMTLLPAVPALNDAYYFAHSDQFERMKLVIATALVGSGVTITWEYWNGAWVSLSGVSDETSGFSVSGEGIISWTLPGDWATTTINSQGPLFYVRARLSALTSISTTPTGSTATIDATRYLPYVADRVISSTGLADIASWTEDTISKFTQ